MWQVTGPRSQVPGPRSHVPGPKSKPISLAPVTGQGPTSQVPGLKSQVQGTRSQLPGNRSQVTQTSRSKCHLPDPAFLSSVSLCHQRWPRIGIRIPKFQSVLKTVVEIFVVRRKLRWQHVSHLLGSRTDNAFSESVTDWKRRNHVPKAESLKKEAIHSMSSGNC